MKKDFYEILGLSKTSTEDEIKKAYRRLAMKYHPDRNPGEDSKVAEEKFKEAKEAYECLSNVDTRTKYDQYGHANPSDTFTKWKHTTDNDLNEEMIRNVFSQMFGGGAAEHIFTQQPRQHQQIHTVTISLADAYTGRSVKVDASTEFNIPRGVRSGTRMFVNNKIYVINVLPHHKFKRSNDDLLVDTDISAIEAMLGVEAVFDHLDGTKLQFTIPAGIQQGQIVKLTGKGMNNPEVDRIGDMLVRISISIPRTLSEEEKTALKSVSHRVSINI